jgi:hypothetical protein
MKLAAASGGVSDLKTVSILGYRLKAGQFPLLWLYSSWAYPRIVESIILFR